MSLKDKIILYWMQAAQRESYNPALDKAIRTANKLSLPLLVLFCINEDEPEANLRHYQFMLEGLWETGLLLQKRQITFLITLGDAEHIITKLSQSSEELILDCTYLRWQREIRAGICTKLKEKGVPYSIAETEAIVPVEVVSPKEEYSAATLRPKILNILPDYLQIDKPSTLWAQTAQPSSLRVLLPEVDYRFFSELNSLEELMEWALRDLTYDRSVSWSSHFHGGYSAALRRLDTFVHHRLTSYAQLHSDPGDNYQSDLSPWLHFGQISSLEITNRVMAACELEPMDVPYLIKHKAEYSGGKASCASFLEELIIRRELSMNFCFYNPEYDNYAAIPLWARETLEEHSSDKRPFLYSTEALENAETHDPYWNAAQKEMLLTGKMHNYMRMYWGKKIIEWTPNPEMAFYLMQYLNNRYELDGCDPNSYAGIAWCFGKHDRPWKTRPIFGSVRYMNAAGLERKFDMQAYIARI
ncbi:MAG: deoxyribodipyrimidine photo-lyase [Candidatus Cloacimonetes bacterium]|nr:deoxyribodipyrimidine photo-lyase [Candidatus Cloacimonadota bacterium]